jgi:hypothetical protein
MNSVTLIIYLTLLCYTLWSWFWLRIGVTPLHLTLQNGWKLDERCFICPIGGLMVTAAGYGATHIFIWNLPLGNHTHVTLIAQLFDTFGWWAIPLIQISREALRMVGDKGRNLLIPPRHITPAHQETPPPPRTAKIIPFIPSP